MVDRTTIKELVRISAVAALVSGLGFVTSSAPETGVIDLRGSFASVTPTQSLKSLYRGPLVHPRSMGQRYNGRRAES